ncbi:RNA polymerase sigma factor [Bacillus timonensis]|uniref:RNA polymerase sigma factor n=1 Tax=Bacillus timonensis TaxID=1033734 RepID=UPI000289482D|nr:RNA polymerase sigma factor [Bacillus timonensis]
MKFNTCQDKAKLKAWLYKITRNQCIDYLRSKVVKTTVLTDNPDELLFSTDKVVEKRMLAKFEREKLHQHLDSLPSDYKQTLSLYYFYDYSYSEISHLLRKDISFVKNKLFRGKQLLRKVYEKKEAVV